MAQSDQSVQNATFPSVRADINDNLAALYSQSSGSSAPSVTVAFQPWVDTSSSPPVWKVRNGSNSAWITVGVLDPAGFNSGGITAIANGGTGATTATAALAALLPSQTGNAGKALVTSGSLASWGVVASGASLQIFTSSGTYTPTSGKTTFLVIATGGGGGATGSGGLGYSTGGGAGTGISLFTTTQMGGTASVTVGSGGGVGSNGGNTVFTPSGTGTTITAGGGGGANFGGPFGTATGGTGSNSTGGQLNLTGGDGGYALNTGQTIPSGTSFWGGVGYGGGGRLIGGSVYGGTQGVVFLLEW